jgi:hypothetical protein
MLYLADLKPEQTFSSVNEVFTPKGSLRNNLDKLAVSVYAS